MWWLIPVFIVFSFIFSSSETALFSLPTYRAKESNFTRKLLKHPRRILITVIIANIFANVAISSLSQNLLGDYLNIFVTTVLMTTIILIFGEYIPKRVAMAKQKFISRIFSPLIVFVQYLLYPIIFLSRPLSRMGSKKKEFTAEELREIMHRGRREGILGEQEYRILQSLSRFNETQVKDIMAPRINVFFVEESVKVDSLLAEMNKWYKRIPVYRENRDKIVGILETKKLFGREGSIDKIMTDPIFVSENMPLIQLLKIFKKTSHKMVIVVNEYGGTAGVVDMEDVKKELMGHVQELEIKEKDENEWVVTGDMAVSELQEKISLPESDEYMTVSGFIYSILERIPGEGEEFSYRDYYFRILDVKNNHIREIEIKKIK